jgi:hypothetical protein
MSDQNEWPWPEGTQVLCVSSNGIPADTRCTRHIWITLTEPQEVDYGCGWVQAAKCLVCETMTPKITADFWFHKAAEHDVQNCVARLDAEIHRLQRVAESLLHGGGVKPMTLDD